VSTLALLFILLLLFTYVGYPVSIALLSRISPRRSFPQRPFEPTVTVCVPLYNASAYLSRKIASLLTLDYPTDKLDFLFVDDGSTDECAAILDAYANRDPRIRYLRSPFRRGKPSALNWMRKEATGEVLLMTDARQPIERGALRALVAALAPEEVGCVSGNLEVPTSAGAGVYWRYEKWIRKSEANFRSLVGVSGALYVIRKVDLIDLPEDLILDDVWIPLRLRLQGRQLLFCEEAVAYDEVYEDDREFGRKVRTLAGNCQLVAKLPTLIVPFVHPSWFEFWSHKLLRLLCPFVLVLLILLSLMGTATGQSPIVFFRLLLIGQLLFYAAALLGRRAGGIGRLCRTFVVLNVAALVGLWRFLRGLQRVTW
jgi:biofilm PGA synthesis N-glycosyltransferase PgaC